MVRVASRGQRSASAIAPRWVATTVDLRANDYAVGGLLHVQFPVSGSLRIAKEFAIKSTNSEVLAAPGTVNVSPPSETRLSEKETPISPPV